jgi:hypothetical protein
MSRPTAAYILFAILACTCFVLMTFSRDIPYTNSFSTVDNPLLIMDYNIACLFQLVLRFDHMLQIIYFGFLLALFWLGYVVGGMQMRIGELENKVMMGEMGMRGEVKHPAYAFEMEEGCEVLRRIVELEKKRVVRIEELEMMVKEIDKEQRRAAEEDKEMSPPVYTLAEMQT